MQIIRSVLHSDWSTHLIGCLYSPRVLWFSKETECGSLSKPISRGLWEQAPQTAVYKSSLLLDLIYELLLENSTDICYYTVHGCFTSHERWNIETRAYAPPSLKWPLCGFYQKRKSSLPADMQDAVALTEICTSYLIPVFSGKARVKPTETKCSLPQPGQGWS